jgi:hypothetical protein
MEGVGSRYKLLGPDCVTYVFVFLGSTIICRLYKLTLSNQAQVTLQLRISLYDLGSALTGEKKIFYGDPNPLSTALIIIMLLVSPLIGLRSVET